MAYEVEPNVEIPAVGQGRKSKYPWSEMVVGDSFVVEHTTSSAMSAIAIRAGERLGMKFSCRTMPEGIRVWRVA